MMFKDVLLENKKSTEEYNFFSISKMFLTPHLDINHGIVQLKLLRMTILK